MVGPPGRIKFTYDDDKSAPDEKRYELLDGDIPALAGAPPKPE